MNGFMKFATCSLLISAGCQAPASLSNWSHRDDLRNAAATDQLSERIEKNSPGLQSKAAELQAPQKSVDELVRLGQSEVSDWYRDKSPQRLRAARGHFESALALAPQSSSAHHGIAIIADLEGNFSEAERHYQQALIQKPNDSDILGDVGYSYLLQGRYSESEQYSLRAIQASANNINAVKHLGDAYARQGKTQLAQETYAKVYSPEEVQKALADHQPVSSPFSIQTDKTNSSIFDRLLPGKTPAEKLAADIQRRQQEYNEQLQRQPHPRSRPAVGGPTGQGSERLAQEHILRQQLQDIDRQEMARHQEGPILIDERTGQLTRLPGAENSGYGMNGNIAAANFGPMSLQAPHPAHPGGFAPGYSNPGGYDPANAFPAQNPMNGASMPPYAPSSPPQYSPQQFASTDPNFSQASSAAVQPGLPRGASPQQMRADVGPQPPQINGNGIRPWTGIQHADASSTGTSPYFTGDPQSGPVGPGTVIQANAQANVPQNAGQFPQRQPVGSNPAPQFAPNGPQGPVNGMGAAPGQGGMGDFAGMANGISNGVPSQNPNLNHNALSRTPEMAQGNQPTSPGNAYQQASRTAARMGMGLGPGGIFPVSDASRTIQPPGSMSYENSNVPAPQRWMPDTITPPNLSAAFQPIPNRVQAPNATTGPTPPVTYPSYSPEQFGTASRYDTRTMQTSGVPLDYNNSMQGYEAQRWIAGREANIAVQQIWNQGPINTPVSPNSGSQYTHPNSSGMMYTPNAVGPDGRTLMPEQWPYPAVARPSPEQMQQNNPDAVQRASFLNGQSLSAQQGQQTQPGFGNPANHPDNQGPMGNRNGMSGAPMTPAGTAGSSQTPANVIVPTDYRNYLRQNAPTGNGTGVNSTRNDPADWPTIIPASR